MAIDALALGLNRNVQAWGFTLRRSEEGREPSPADYWQLVGGGSFWNSSDHPRIVVRIKQYRDANGRLHGFSDRFAPPAGMEPTGVELDSTAAGAFQYLARTWDGLRARHPDLIDFSAPMQDRALIYLLDDLHAIDPIVAGDIGGALAACCKTWASLPGAGYGQHENSASDIEGWFVQYGGTLAKSGA